MTLSFVAIKLIEDGVFVLLTLTQGSCKSHDLFWGNLKTTSAVNAFSCQIFLF